MTGAADQPMPLPVVTTASSLDAELCTAAGVGHDYRRFTYQHYGRPHTSLRCVWCHVVACGDEGQDDPCVEPYHHAGDHRTRGGVTWPVGGSRP